MKLVFTAEVKPPTKPVEKDLPDLCDYIGVEIKRWYTYSQDNSVEVNVQCEVQDGQ